MAGKLGTFLSAQSFEYGSFNPNISPGVNGLTPATLAPLATYDPKQPRGGGSYSSYKIAPSNRWSIVGIDQPNFFRDYYFRIHVQPLRIDLQTVASSQSREVTVWNSYPFTAAQLNEILVSNRAGIEIVGQSAPFSIAPLQELVYDVTVGTSGPPNINSEIQFDFSNVANPLPILVTGTRAVKFDVVPEVPVNETWEWLTDNIVAVDGTEQRIALRGEMPRIEESLKVIFDSQELIRKFYADLISCAGRLFIPEFQYATQINQDSAVGTFQLYFNISQTDVRIGEYVLIQTPINSALVELRTLNEFGAITTSALSFEVPKGSLIMPGSPALINNNTKIARLSVNEVAETTLVVKMIRQREVLQRPGSTTALPLFLGKPLLEKRPLADSSVNDSVSTGQQQIDNATGIPDIIRRWDYSRIGGEREFKVNRVKNPEELDYWKAFFAYTRGAVRKFWIPTFRPDLIVAESPAVSSNNLKIKGSEYAEKIWPILTHRYIEIETEAGIHRTTITGANAIGDFTFILFNPPLPAGVGYTNIFRVSYLLPVRLDDDKITWKHYGLESILQFSIITAEP